MIDKDEFGQWRDNPITQAVFKRVGQIADQAKDKWIEDSWSGGRVDPLMLADLRARAEVANDLVNLTFEDIDDEDDKSKRNPSD